MLIICLLEYIKQKYLTFSCPPTYGTLNNLNYNLRKTTYTNIHKYKGIPRGK